MSILIRDVREHELDLVLALNNAAGPGILPMDAAKLSFFWEHADYFRVAEKDGLLAGFLVALGQDAGHDQVPALDAVPVLAQRAAIDRRLDPLAGEMLRYGLGARELRATLRTLEHDPQANRERPSQSRVPGSYLHSLRALPEGQHGHDAGQSQGAATRTLVCADRPLLQRG